jgi:thiosulfate/3-mercaptopyruvate sulfurtransferase
MLRWVGHDAVAVLDGGLAKWLAERRPVTTIVPQVAHTTYPVGLRSESTVGISFVEQHRRDVLLLDARSPERFRGEKEPIDKVAGHIPGARNRFSNDNLAAEGTFKAPAELKKEFEAVLGDRAPSEVVSYCGSGVAACHNLLAMELAGLHGGKLYAGSSCRPGEKLPEDLLADLGPREHEVVHAAGEREHRDIAAERARVARDVLPVEHHIRPV